MRISGILAVLLVLAACGKEGNLVPQKGKSLPPAPVTSPKVPTPEQLMTPATEARPTRVDEVLRKNVELKDDRFDTPPAEK